jgi:dihydroflavonol-4-reductase
MDGLVVVTGASGFIGGHVVATLLARGYRVRGTVRSTKDPKKVADLTALPGAERLELVEADLLDRGSLRRAMTGATALLHTASPYVLSPSDPQRDLVDPAVQGTLAALEAARAEPLMRRVVVTSSFAALSDEPDADHVLTDADWNEASSLTRNPYYYSKVLAEKAAWKFVDTERPGFDLVTINPCLVIGPSLTAGLNTSNGVFVDVLRGVYPGVLSLAWAMVDVRDVALAHVLAIETPTARGRYLCGAETLTMREMCGALAASGRKVPTLNLDHAVGRAILWLASWTQPSGVGTYLRTNLGKTTRFDNSRIRADLGMTFRDVRASITETVPDLVRWGHLPA